MATQVPAELAAVHEAARTELVSALSEATSDAAPAPAVTETAPAPAPQVESPSPAVAAQPDSTEGRPPSEQPAPIQINPNDLSPEAKRFLEMKGGDINRALADALEYNNRLGKNAEPAAPPPLAPEPPVVLDAGAIEQRVEQFLAKDQESVSIVNFYRANTAQLIDIAAREKAVSAELVDHISWLKLPEVQAEPYRKAELEGRVHQLKAEAQLIRLERGNLDREKRELEMAYDGRAENYRTRLVQHERQREEQARTQAARDESIRDHAKTLASTWPVALDQIAKDKHLTSKQVARFEKRAQDAALARLDSGLGPIEDVRGFLEAEATAYVEDMVEYHREQSAQYATQTAQRAAQPGSTGALSGVTEAGQPQFKDLEDVKAAARKDALARLGTR